MMPESPGSPEVPADAAARDRQAPLAGRTATDLLVATRSILSEHGIPDAAIEARTLVRAALKISQTDLLLGSGRRVNPDDRAALDGFVSRRIGREPLQYITGTTGFFGRDFLVDERVLIPRPETELLVEHALLSLRERDVTTPRVLDIGTGSGILAVTLAAEVPEAKVVATDISPEAIDVAKENAELNGVSQNIEFRICSAVHGLTDRFDVILCNPPYVLTSFLDGSEAQPELAFEPRTALDGGPDGMAVYSEILPGLGSVLVNGGSAYIEIDPPVAEECVALAKQHITGASISVLTDLAGLERCLVIELSGS